MRIKNNLLSLLILLIGMLASGVIAVAIGKELNWDLASYHFYNPFAFFQQRAALDAWPFAFVHVHLAPTADFLTYYLINFLPTKAAVFLLGAVHGINFWLIYLIARELLNSLPGIKYSRALALLLAAIGMYGPLVVPGIGSFQHDALVSIFVLGFVLLFLKGYQRLSYRLFLASGLLLGIGAGLKLTGAIYIFGALLSVFALQASLTQRLRIMLLLCCSVAAGVLITSGYWMWMQWQHYHNPVFPFLNGIFQAPDFPAYNWKDALFLPKTWLETLFFPFYFSRSE